MDIEALQRDLLSATPCPAEYSSQTSIWRLAIRHVRYRLQSTHLLPADAYQKAWQTTVDYYGDIIATLLCYPHRYRDIVALMQDLDRFLSCIEKQKP